MKEMVNHPDHYKSEAGLEVIDVMEAFTSDLVGIEAIDTSNIIKYICRWKKKNGLQDLEKAKWYLEHLIEHVKKVDEKDCDFDLKGERTRIICDDIHEARLIVEFMELHIVRDGYIIAARVIDIFHLVNQQVCDPNCVWLDISDRLIYVENGNTILDLPAPKKFK